MFLTLFLYLGLFTWNARTGHLDALAERTGLEFIGYVLSPIAWFTDRTLEVWNRYIALVEVAEENAYLREELHRTRISATLSAEEKAELDRLRKLLQVDALYERPGFVARVIAKRFGPKAVLKTFTINKGYLDGAIVGTPVMTDKGVVGRVLRAAPNAATVITLTDPGFRLAVMTRENRTPGILSGTNGPEQRLEVAYIAQTAKIAQGDTLVTSGMDGVFPKGLPVGVVTLVSPGNESLFQQVHAAPFIDVDYLEEVILLQQDDNGTPLLKRLHDPIGSDPSVPAESLLLPPEFGGRQTLTLPYIQSLSSGPPLGPDQVRLDGGPSTVGAEMADPGASSGMDADVGQMHEIPMNSTAPGLFPEFMQRNGTGIPGGNGTPPVPHAP